MKNSRMRRDQSSSAALAENLPLVGLLLVVGAQTYGLFSPKLRYVILGLGVGLSLIYCLLYSRFLRTSANYMLGWLALIGASEGFNLLNSASPFDPRGAAFRVICYIFLLSGIIMGLRHRVGEGDILTRMGRVSLTLTWGVVIGAVFIYWRSVSATLAFTASARFGGDDLNPVGIAFGYGTCMSVAAALLIFDRNPFFRIINGFMLLVLARGLLLTGSRGALLSFIGVVFILGLCKNRYLPATRRVWFLLLAGLLCLSVLAMLTLGGFGQEQAQFYLRRIESLTTGQDAAANARLVTWQLYASRFSSWVLVGYRNYTGSYPHNFFYEWWLRFGLLGLGASLMSLWLVARSVLLMWRMPQPPVVYAIVGALLFGFINAQFNLALEFNRAFWLGVGYSTVFVFGIPRLVVIPRGGGNRMPLGGLNRRYLKAVR